jgi:hypothetical protein
MSLLLRPSFQQIGGSIAEFTPGIETRAFGSGVRGYENPNLSIQDMREARKEFCQSMRDAVQEGVIASSLKAKSAGEMIGATSRMSSKMIAGSSLTSALKDEWNSTALSLPIKKLVEKRSASTQEKNAALADCLQTVLPFVNEVTESYQSNQMRLMRTAAQIGLGIKAGKPPRQVVKQELREGIMKTPMGKFVRTAAPGALSATLIAHNRVRQALTSLGNAPQTPQFESIGPQSKL